MAYESYEEDLLYDVKNYIDTNLGTYLTGIETDKDDGIQLDDIKRYDVGDIDPYAFNQHPACLFNPDEVAYEELSIGSDNLRMSILITIVVKGGKSTNLTIKAMRYAAAVRQCINADKTAGGTIDKMRPARIVHYARPPGIEDKKAVDIIITAEKCIPS